ncbi:Nucleotidyltransferase [Macroventuria anomochaeta]|uniref:Nucleotidyltransferase n=1 Tax=Macroventuria anomochaeta TaxID=301207 RepID=A0ACB6SDY1_9PLEO|nr:Nucleotidyltransferase [Macroventuria anomochaeta]KAF2632431.1 Nucleotidyltransferase [Macroventuria anomochaeta]
MTFTSGGGDNYRPGGAQQGRNNSEFTFASNHDGPRFPPAGPANAGPPARRRNNRGGGQHGQRDSRRGESNGFRGRGGGRGGYRKPGAHERALLTVQDCGSPERTLGVADGSNKFMNLNEMSEDEQEEEISKDTEATSTDAEKGVHKVARTANGRADGDSVPKWSNPEIYSALPPPEELRPGKKIDFVQLIRKAKNEAAEKADGNNAVAANDDFISFGDDDGSAKGTDLQSLDNDEPRTNKRPQNGGFVQGPMNDLDYVDSIINGGSQNKRSHQAADLHEQPQQSKAKRKRGEVENVRGIVQEWMGTARCDTAPWLDPRHNYAHLVNDPLKWLHNEILDFYDFVAPQPYEHDVRHRLVQRVQQALGTQRFPQDTGRILCFGSFPAGLYLPTADMDLVYTSDRFYQGGPAAMDFSNKSIVNSTLRKAARRLENVCIATNVLCITKAKVPIIKFVDRVTNINVDISFENLSGVQAQATFQQWKHDYPDMIYMVALLKQFLVMRGMNEVHTGGIGGFTIICLVISYFQHSKKPENLGDCFLGFLNYYGNEFDLRTQRIQMHPPAIVRKDGYDVDGREERPNGLSIQDPNRPENNISGGSHKAWEVFQAFRSAHRVLKDRIDSRSPGRSILECLLGGNYETYIVQRRHMQTLK